MHDTGIEQNIFEFMKKMLTIENKYHIIWGKILFLIMCGILLSNHEILINKHGNYTENIAFILNIFNYQIKP